MNRLQEIEQRKAEIDKRKTEIRSELETVEESVDASNFSVFGCAVDSDDDYMTESEYEELVEIFDSL